MSTLFFIFTSIECLIPDYDCLPSVEWTISDELACLATERKDRTYAYISILLCVCICAHVSVFVHYRMKALVPHDTIVRTVNVNNVEKKTVILIDPLINRNEISKETWSMKCIYDGVEQIGTPQLYSLTDPNEAFWSWLFSSSQTMLCEPIGRGGTVISISFLEKSRSKSLVRFCEGVQLRCGAPCCLLLTSRLACM